MPEIRVALVDDYEIVLQGLRALLRPYAPGISVVELDVKVKPARTVDVTLLDTYGETTGMSDRVQEIASDPSNGAIVVFSFSDDVTVANAAIDAGARGFISKATPAPEIVDGIRAAARGEQITLVNRSQQAVIAPELLWPGRERHLSARESELLALLPTGMTNRELGAQLYLSENTIKTQLRSLFSKLGVRNRVQAVAVARAGLLGEQRSRRIDGDDERSAPAHANDEGEH
jgi:two-component system, NarL family, response regulator LiaR